MSQQPPQISQQAVLMQSGQLPEDVDTPVKGHDFNAPDGLSLEALMKSFATTGFQGTNLSLAIDEINRMLDCKFAKPEEAAGAAAANGDSEVSNPNPYGRARTNCTIFLAFTSNMISSGVRESIRYLVEHNLVDVLVTTGGAVEEDLIKCMHPTYIGDFHRWPGAQLRQAGINRIGNLLVPNKNYCAFESWLVPILDVMLAEQNEQKINWTPSKLIHRLGREINSPESVLYWCHRNGIPVFCPSITDGACGDVLYFHSYRSPGLVLDAIEDIRLVNSQAVFARNTGMIVLGGGVVKHHTCNANLMRNGANFAVFINTGQEFDGSDSGARPDEAVSWGKIRLDARPVKVYSDATLAFPLIVAQTFAKRLAGRTEK
ncbi:hypothetical protein BOX15_Mlig033358g9 [Macrostomum lignano]|uniref:deoxyhypusine synthase n=1 Tax=Macrostomum lignano TaxID=282301 RepID=A0A267G7F9_9PLAT|nr:hypothetical protein BOX15_Mlig033358g9 [Macrostomum lignano]